ncbi:MAG: serine/threonine protein kinase [Elusimicrobia bacterium]|nr:serine/threonine protein kinase [Elusimicrobiota bacterium]
MLSVKPGEVLDNYKIKKIIAQGAMGSVYKAQDMATGKIVALKIPNEGYDKDLISLQRFRQAEKIGYLLEHENIVKVYNPSRKDSRIPYCTMEYIEGHSLQYEIQRLLRIEVETAIRYTLQMCNVLIYLRHKEIIHHDIKPANILLGENKIIKLTDFGISWSKDLQADTWASLVRVGGTPAYMAPEKVKDHAMDDYRSDIYSVGILMYHLMTGKLPFSGSSTEIINNQLTNNFIPPAKLNPRISSPVEKIIVKAMAFDPVARFQYAAELKENLLAVSREIKPPGGVNGTAGAGIKPTAFFRLAVVIIAVVIVLAWIMLKNR